MYKPENRIYISLQRDIPINSQAGIFEFDSLRNLVRNDTFTQNFTTAIANLVRYDNCLYVIGNLNSTPTTFMGQTFYPKNPGTSGNGIINFLMKVDLNRNLVWKRELNSITPIGSILGNKFIVDKTNQRLIVFGRGTKPFKIDHDSMYVDTLLGSGKIMATIFDTAGNLQQWDYWKNNNPIYSDQITVYILHNGTIYAGGEHLSTIWTQDSSYSRTSNGGDEDFLILKYGFNCDCTPATSSFTYSKSGYDTLHFNYTGTFFGIDSFVWDFGDGSPKVSNILNPTHVYAPGTYTAFVKVYDSCGNTQSGKTIYVPCYFLTSHFTYSTNYQDISLTYTGTNNADSVRWNLGNGQWLTGTTASYTYPQSGTYEVCAIAYKGCTDTFCQQVVINCFEPVCSFTYDTMATLQLNLTYNGTTADSIRWFLGNGSEDTGSTLSYTYPLPGTYPVCAVAYKGCGSDTFCQTIEIDCPVITSSYYHTPNQLTITYTYDGTPVDTVRWLLGDGNQATGTTVTHSYTNEGVYDVCAIAESVCGIDTFCREISVHCTSVNPSFTYTQDKLTVRFTYTGTILPYTPEWNFGDGNSDTGYAVSHTYGNYQSYTVCVRSENMCGSESYCDNLDVLSSSKAYRGADDITIYPNPATGTLKITGISKLWQYKITTVSGATVHTGTVNKRNNSIVLSKISSGTYIIELSDKQGNKINKQFMVMGE